MSSLVMGPRGTCRWNLTRDGPNGPGGFRALGTLLGQWSAHGHPCKSRSPKPPTESLCSGSSGEEGLGSAATPPSGPGRRSSRRGAPPGRSSIFLVVLPPTETPLGRLRGSGLRWWRALPISAQVPISATGSAWAWSCWIRSPLPLPPHTPCPHEKIKPHPTSKAQEPRVLSWLDRIISFLACGICALLNPPAGGAGLLPAGRYPGLSQGLGMPRAFRAEGTAAAGGRVHIALPSSDSRTRCWAFSQRHLRAWSWQDPRFWYQTVCRMRGRRNF